MTRRIAFFGGSFDPPHYGHLKVARAARQALALDTVLFAPVGTQPLKPDGATASFADRLEMTRLAVSGEPGFEVSSIDAPKPGGAPNYTVETLCRLHEELPAGSKLFCLVGADSLAGFRHWHRAAEIPFLAPLVVASRPGRVLDRIEKMLPDGLILRGSSADESLPAQDEVPLRVYELTNALGHQTRLYLLPGLDVDVSATRLRASIAAGSDSGGVSSPESVYAYIRTHRLYR